MRALTYAAFGGPIEVAEVPDPAPTPGGAIVKVLASGLCRSDWHGWQGHDRDIAVFPHVPGHEFAGTVTAVGDGVDPGWLGRVVTAPFVMACGQCAVCRAGDGQVCPSQRQPGFSDPGSFAEFVTVHAAATNLVALPEGLDPGEAAGLGCRVATAYRAVVARAAVAAGETVVVIGCGGVGLAAIAVARGRGARVCGVDLDPGSRARALECGAEMVLDGALAEADLVAAVMAWSAGGARVSIDALGSESTCRTGILALGRRGRHVQVGLMPVVGGSGSGPTNPSAGAVPMDRVIGWELDVLGCHGMAARDYVPLLEDCRTGRLDLGALRAVGPPLGLAEAAVALATMGSAPSRGFVLIDPSR